MKLLMLLPIPLCAQLMVPENRMTQRTRPGLARTAALFYGQIRTGARTKLLHLQKRFMHLGGSFLDVFYHDRDRHRVVRVSDP